MVEVAEKGGSSSKSIMVNTYIKIHFDDNNYILKSLLEDQLFPPNLLQPSRTGAQCFEDEDIDASSATK